MASLRARLKKIQPRFLDRLGLALIDSRADTVRLQGDRIVCLIGRDRGEDYILIGTSWKTHESAEIFHLLAQGGLEAPFMRVPSSPGGAGLEEQIAFLDSRIDEVATVLTREFVAATIQRQEEERLSKLASVGPVEVQRQLDEARWPAHRKLAADIRTYPRANVAVPKEGTILDVVAKLRSRTYADLETLDLWPMDKKAVAVIRKGRPEMTDWPNGRGRFFCRDHQCRKHT